MNSFGGNDGLPAIEQFAFDMYETLIKHELPLEESFEPALYKY